MFMSKPVISGLLLLLLALTGPHAGAQTTPVQTVAPAVEADAVRAWLKTWRSGAFLALDDAEVARRFQGVPPAVLAASLKAAVEPLNSYELWVQRQERLKGVYNERPFLNHMKYTHAPRRLYVKWLDGGPSAGQEMIYDETRRADQVYGHLGGLLNIRSVWLSFDSSIIRGNTRHNLRDELSLQYFMGTVAERLVAISAAGGQAVASAEVISSGRTRQIQLNLLPDAKAPPGPFSQERWRVTFDLSQPQMHAFERWDSAGQPLERIVVDRLRIVPLQAIDFDPANPQYRF